MESIFSNNSPEVLLAIGINFFLSNYSVYYEFIYKVKT